MEDFAFGIDSLFSLLSVNNVYWVGESVKL